MYVYDYWVLVVLGNKTIIFVCNLFINISLV